MMKSMMGFICHDLFLFDYFSINWVCIATKIQNWVCIKKTRQFAVHSNIDCAIIQMKKLNFEVQLQKSQLRQLMKCMQFQRLESRILNWNVSWLLSLYFRDMNHLAKTSQLIEDQVIKISVSVKASKSNSLKSTWKDISEMIN